MDSGKVAAECETHRRHAICSPDTAVFVSVRFSRFVQNEVANIFPCENIHMRATFQLRQEVIFHSDAVAFLSRIRRILFPNGHPFLFDFVGKAAFL